MIRNWSDFDRILREIALINVQADEARAARNQAVIDAETTYNTATAAPLARKAALSDELEIYYKAHRKEVETEGKRSIELVFGKAGMRKGNPTLSCLKGWKWEKVLDAIKDRYAKNRDRLKELVSTKESINKDAVKAADLSADELTAIGVKIKQDDEFWYEVFPDKAAQSRAA